MQDAPSDLSGLFVSRKGAHFVPYPRTAIFDPSPGARVRRHSGDSEVGESPSHRLRGELGACRDSELGEDVAQVHLDGAAGDEHALGDLRVGEPGGDQADDPYARSESGSPSPPSDACVRRAPSRRTRSSRRARGSRLRSSAARRPPRREARAPPRCAARVLPRRPAGSRARSSIRSASAAAKQRTASLVLSASSASVPSASSVAAIPGRRSCRAWRRERSVQQVFGFARLAAIVGDERALVLDQREQPIVADRCHERRRLVERGLRAVEVAADALRRAERAEQLADHRPAARRLASPRSAARGESHAAATSPVASAMSARR